MKADHAAFLIDCDSGWDDIAAVCLALNFSKTIEVSAVSTVFGNSSLLKAIKIMRYTLCNLERNEINLFRGASGPIGKSVNLKDNVAIETLMASDFMCNFGRVVNNIDARGISDFFDNWPSDSENTNIMCLGPLTNIYNMIKFHPNLKPKLLILGGNWEQNPHINEPEFNFSMDAFAAQQVLQSDLKKTIVPIEICNKVCAKRFIVQNPFQAGIGVMVWNDIVNTYIKRCSANNTPSPLYDPLVIFLINFPQAFKIQRRGIKLITTNDGRFRNLVIDDVNGNVADIVTDVDVELLRRLFFEEIMF